MSSESWPPQLKEWVANCLGQMSDSNRTEAQAELRQVIADAFVNNTLWTTDWKGVQLKSLLPKSNAESPLNHLKRKFNEASISGSLPNHKKTKKNIFSKGAGHNTLDPTDEAALNRRAARFQREHNIERQKHLNGYGNHVSSIHANPSTSYLFHSRSQSPAMAADDPEADPNVPNWDRHTIVGTSEEIFKDYLRLTSEPKPERIRPLNVLQKTLEALKTRWREKQSYNWICSQFKSLRQDLTVQRIKNEFTVSVYEIHARMALEVGDMVEYNSCQAMLRNLYDLGIPGKHEEFTAYRILLLLHGRNRSDLNLYVGQLTAHQKSSAPVKHALAVQRALSLGNYHAFFDLYLNAPNMGAYIMDHFITRERIKALIIMTKSYLSLSLAFIQTELAFDTLGEARTFLDEHGANIYQNPDSLNEQAKLDCKPCHIALTQVFEEKFRKVQIKGAV